MQKKRILFICTHNSARSQMAEGFINALYGDSAQGFSAGTEPSKVNPMAVDVMKEIGIDISHHRSKGIEELRNQEFDCVVTVCDQARETCPFFPGGRKKIHRGFEDPSLHTGNSEAKREVFRRIRDQIRQWIEAQWSQCIDSQD